MKKIIYLLIFFTAAAAAQNVNVPDASFKARLLASSTTNGIAKDINGIQIKIDSSDDGEIQVSEALNVYALDVSNATIADLTGLERFLNLRNLNCKANQLTNLPLTNLTALINLNCSFNQITAIVLSGINLFSIDCSHNLLTILDLTDSTNIEDVYCNNNQLTEINLGVCQGLVTFDCSNNQLTSLDLANATSIECMACSNNQLWSINFKNGRINQFGTCYLELSGNPNLTYICTDRFEEGIVRAEAIRSGYPDLVINSYCNFPPAGDYNTIQGSIKYDMDGDGCNNNDSHADFVGIRLTATENAYDISTDSDGNYRHYVYQGTFTVTPQLENPDFFIVTPANATVVFPENNNTTVTENFCITANGVHPDIEVAISTIVPASPGFETTYKISYKNKGNQTLSGNIDFTFDDAHLNFTVATTSVTSQIPGMLTFAYTDLLPFENREIVVTFYVNTPTQVPAVNIGDILNFTASVTPADEIPADNVFVLNATVVGSFDPNNKACLEGEILGMGNIGKYLHYNINFENTGNAAAENVVITDAIDITKFDLSSIQVLNSSHPVDVKIISGNIVEFVFENINLPSSIRNPIGGHGNVLFKIRTNPNLSIGDSVENTANIYFDYNAPIVTNEAKTTFRLLKNQEFEIDKSVKVHPNPAKDFVKIQSKGAIRSIDLFDVQGRILQTSIENKKETSIDLSQQSNGIYFLKISTEKGSKIEKLIKE